MSAKTSSLVPLEELAFRLGGGHVEMVVARLAVEGHAPPVEDWQGRLAVPADVAAKLVASFEREVESIDAKRSAYEAYLVEHERQRREVGAQAYRKAANEAELEALKDASFVSLSAPTPGPRSRQAGREARQAAELAFDAKHPLKTLAEFKG